jgi:3-oxoadipate CoA-transferase alpha subunit
MGQDRDPQVAIAFHDEDADLGPSVDMINKFVRSMAHALDGVRDGATILLGGFGAVGQADPLIDGLLELGVKRLTIVANNAGDGRTGLSRLLAAGRIERLICSYPRIAGAAVVAGSAIFDELYRAGRVELELTPQGTLAERLRAAGAGIPAFFTPAGVGTLLAANKEVRRIGDRDYVLEYALRGDVALVDAWKADRWGNLVYRGTARNFNPIMAAAADLTVACTHNLAELGELDPEAIATPGIYVHRVFLRPEAAAHVC